MKLCKRETFLYWFVHSIVWIGIALPTVFFLLRVNHPRHDAESKSKHNNDTNYKNKLAPIYESCRNHSCASDEKMSSSKSRYPSSDEAIQTIVDAISFTKNTSVCKKRLADTLCIKKFISCSRNNGDKDLEIQLADEANTFCATCLVNSNVIKIDISFQKERYKWLKNLTCISEMVNNMMINISGKNSTSCSYPLVRDENSTCRIPCDWSLMSPKLRDIFYAVMVVNFWAALITTLITLATLASFSKMREFPHIVRFYILICSAMYATASLLPLRIGLAKVYCGGERFWKDEGHSTIPTVIEGVITHYFFLAFCFWSLGYVMNAYSVIIRQAHNVFDKKRKYHLIQFSVCSTLPALFVAVNMAARPPGYKSLFLDRMTSVFTSSVLEYLTFTLPVQISIGVAVSFLWSIIRFVRKVRQSDTSFQSVRPDKDIRGFINAERQFIKLAVLFIVTVAVVLSSEVVITYRNEVYLHKVDEYFECLKTSNKDCQKPEVQIYFLSSVKICGPGIYCLLNFFLLFFNKDTRSVWRKWLRTCCNLLPSRRCVETDGKSSTRREGLPTNTEPRPRSCTLDTNASMNSLLKLSKYTTETALLYASTLQKDLHLKPVRSSNEQNTSMAGSISQEEDSPLNVNGNTASC